VLGVPSHAAKIVHAGDCIRQRPHAPA
jgi:hypothetical protein